MSAKKFNTPFAILGDKVEVPVTAQIDGSVSFEQGYPFGYEADYTDPNSKDISRSKTNQLLFDITNAIREIQQGGASEWSEEGKPYKINSLVYAPDGTIKQSLIANNNNDTTHSSWSNLVNKQYVDENAKLNINSFPEKIPPSDTDNLALQETGGLLKKLSFANLMSWIKSFSFGWGQAWQNVTGSRSAGVTYTNDTGKPIFVSIVGVLTTNLSTPAPLFQINGIDVAWKAGSGAGANMPMFIYLSIPAGATYKLIDGLFSPSTNLKWLELR